MKTAEVGNIFNFGTQKTDEMGLYYIDEDNQQKSLHIGSYGIGVTRVMGVIAEKFSDDRGLVWPDAIAPFRVYIARLGDSAEVVKAADSLYEELVSDGITCLYDDSDNRPGEKFADADLIGLPHRIVISEKTVKESKIEYKKRTEKDSQMMSIEELKKQLTM